MNLRPCLQASVCRRSSLPASNIESTGAFISEALVITNNWSWLVVHIKSFFVLDVCLSITGCQFKERTEVSAIGCWWGSRDGFSDGLIKLVAFCWQNKSFKDHWWLGKISLVWVDGDLTVSTTFQKLSDMVYMGCRIVILGNSVINYSAIARQFCKSFVHLAILVLWYRRDSTWSSQGLELPKRHN